MSHKSNLYGARRLDILRFDAQNRGYAVIPCHGIVGPVIGIVRRQIAQIVQGRILCTSITMLFSTILLVLLSNKSQKKSIGKLINYYRKLLYSFISAKQMARRKPSGPKATPIIDPHPVWIPLHNTLPWHHWARNTHPLYPDIS